MAMHGIDDAEINAVMRDMDMMVTTLVDTTFSTARSRFQTGARLSSIMAADASNTESVDETYELIDMNLRPYTIVSPVAASTSKMHIDTPLIGVKYGFGPTESVIMNKSTPFTCANLARGMRGAFCRHGITVDI